MHHPTGHPRAAHRQIVVSRRASRAFSMSGRASGRRFALLLPQHGHPSGEDATPQCAESRHPPKQSGDDCLRVIGVVSPSVNQVLARVPSTSKART